MLSMEGALNFTTFCCINAWKDWSYLICFSYM